LKTSEESLRNSVGLLPEMLNAFPILMRIPGLAEKVFPEQKAFMDMLDELLTEHKITWDPEQPHRDLTDAYMAEVVKAKGNPESSFNNA
ncbi:cytochrome P450, partial [Klebsiella pneumoniae]|nr:cytochrome P450 [Klebsiella pneumoniae]